MSNPTKREWLVTQGLAKAGVVGRFSNEAKAALEKAVADGVKFAEDEPKAPATPRESKPKAEKIVINQPYDAGKVRKWALAQGLQVGERGRVRPEIVKAYLDANGAGGEAVVAPKPAPPVALRPETVAWVKSARPEGAPSYVSEPLVQISNCGKCGRGISFCPCNGGPYAPSYLTNGNASVQAWLVKPTV